VYDYLGRRVEKQVSEHNGTSWSVSDRRRFVYSFGRPGSGGWWGPLEIPSDRWWCWSHRFGGLPYVLELEGGAGVPPANTILRKYTWGLDLAGQNQSPERERGVTVGGAGGTLDPIASRQGQVGDLLVGELEVVERRRRRLR
jgi:hypothetical protein